MPLTFDLWSPKDDQSIQTTLFACEKRMSLTIFPFSCHSILWPKPFSDFYSNLLPTWMFYLSSFVQLSKLCWIRSRTIIDYFMFFNYNKSKIFQFFQYLLCVRKCSLWTRLKKACQRKCNSSLCSLCIEWCMLAQGGMDITNEVKNYNSRNPLGIERSRRRLSIFL